MSDPSQKTVIASILFLDIVAYSERSVAQQLDWKGNFNTILSNSIAHIGHDDRIILDTGDGAAVCFLDNPEDALDVAIACLYGFTPDSDERPIECKLRIGINLGPIKIVRDINGQRNIIGDGINVAQRVMSFADPNRIFVSRSFYDVAAYLTRRNMEIFRFRGVHKDKHGREHEIYEVLVPGLTPEKAPTIAAIGAHSAPAPASAQIEQGLSPLDGEVLKAIEKQLAHYVGPIAGTLLKRAMKNASSNNDLCARLCDAISHQHERDAFEIFFRHHAGGQSDTHHGDGAQPLQRSPTPDISTLSGVRLPAFKLQPEQLAQAEHELALILGPIAKLLVTRQANSARSFAEFCQGLADKIEDRQQREQLLETLKRI